MVTRFTVSHFAVYTNIKSLHCSPETITMLYVHYTSFFFKDSDCGEAHIFTRMV